jgi:hypothetical protein
MEFTGRVARNLRDGEYKNNESFAFNNRIYKGKKEGGIYVGN